MGKRGAAAFEAKEAKSEHKRARTAAADSGLVDPLVTFFREQLEGQEHINRLLQRTRDEVTEANRFITNRLHIAEGYIDVLETRLDDLENVVRGLLTRGHPTTRAETEVEVREAATDTTESDFLWRILLEVETDFEDGEAALEEFRVSEEDLEAMDRLLDEADV